MKEMLNKQFSLDESAQVFWQEQANNPLAGICVAKLVKGQDALKPEIEIIPHERTEKEDPDLIKKHIESWFEEYVEKTVEVLVGLKSVETQSEAVEKIAEAILGHMGVIPRAQIEGEIKELSEEDRRVLRECKIKLGPLLVFQPPLNKPASIKLRALLWSIWHEKALPVSLPPEGVVSFKVEDPEAFDPVFMQTIGYPIFGPKAIRIDMLDRVIVDIYDSAKDWEFTAKHQYAEWLGSNIEDLYVILEAMGHKKISDPNAGKEDKEGEEAEIIRDAEGKPLLATFKLRKGRMSKEAKTFKGKRQAAKKAHTSKPNHKKKSKPQSKKPQIIHAAAKGQESDNPFAVLQQLKNK